MNVQKMCFGLWLSVVLAVFTGCQGDERLKEKAELEGRANADEQVKAEKKYLEERAQEMEADLSQRQRFYIATSGVYEGTMKIAGGQDISKVRLTFTPSLPPYNSNRIRTMEEIASDLNNLYFNVQVTQWSDVGDMKAALAFGCVFENVRPDLKTGQINLAASECTSVYRLNLSDELDVVSPVDVKSRRERGIRLAEDILENRETNVTAMRGVRQVTNAARIFELSAKKIDE